MIKPVSTLQKFVKLLCIATLFQVLFACGNNGVDKAKVDSVEFDAHFLFFDQDLQAVKLNPEEAGYYFALKAGDEKLADAVKKQGGDMPGAPAPAADPPSTGGTPTPPASPAPVPARATSYVDDCREAKVPIPPPFGQPTWEELQPLNKDQIFSGPDYNPLYIWRYKSAEPEGLCAATVRYKKGQNRMALT